MSEFIPPRAPVGQRPPKRESTFGQQRKPLRTKKPLKAKPRERAQMSPDARVQDAMIEIAGRCYVGNHMPGDCTDGRSQRSHIISQALIRKVFPRGAWRSPGETVYRPIEPYVDLPEDAEIVTRQEILDDDRNLVLCCPNHNRDGREMVDALNAVGFPEGFGQFCHEFTFEFNGRFWHREGVAA